MIKIKVNTNGFGGRSLTKQIKVTTDDPDTPVATLAVKGFVEKVVDITPASFFFQGDSGTVMEKAVTLMPVEKYPMNIIELKLANGKGLSHEVRTTQVNGRKTYVIVVKTLVDARGNFRDRLLIKTDSKVKPLITIWVNVQFKEKPGAAG